MSNRVLVAVAFSLSAVFALSPAAYAQGAETTSVRVAYGDLNLDTSNGAQAAARWRQVSRRTCGDSRQRLTLAEKTHKCNAPALVLAGA